MIKFLLMNFIFFISNVLYADIRSSPCLKSAAHYALAVAGIQYAQHSTIKSPFRIIDVQEVTKQYFKEIKGSAKNRFTKNLHDKVIVYSVAFESLNHWQCQYYVEFHQLSHENCQFKNLVFDHCAL